MAEHDGNSGEVGFGPRRIELHEHAAAVARPCTVLLLRDLPGARPRAHGSGVLVSIANSHLIFTAAHVADAYPIEQLAIGIPPPNSMILPLAGSRVFATETTRGDHKDDPLDVGVIHLRTDAAAEIEKSCRFVTCDDFDSQDPIRLDSLYLVVGYPIEGVKLEEGRGQVKQLDLDVFPKERGSVCGENIDEDSNFFVEWRSTLFHRIDGGYADAPHPEGISGSGVWRVARIEDQIRAGPCPRPRLVGIETSAYGDDKSLKVTRIKRLTEHLRRWMPELTGPLGILLPRF